MSFPQPPDNSTLSEKGSPGQRRSPELEPQSRPRKRVSQACERCRLRKDKCDGGRPKCTACVRRNHVCSYDPSVKKRGLPEGYVRDLETYTEGLEAYLQDVEAALAFLVRGNRQNETAMFPKNGTGVPQNGGLNRIWSSQEESEDLRRIWLESKVAEELKKRHPVTNTIEEKLGKRKRSINYVPEISQVNLDPRSPLQNAGSRLAGQSESDTPGVDQQTNESIDAGSDITIASNLEFPTNGTYPDALPTRAWKLLHIYFAYTHCWFPVAEKYDVIKTFHEFSSKKTEIRRDSGSNAVLWSILAFADTQDTSPRMESTNGRNNYLQHPTDLYTQARRLIPTEDGFFEIGHIQALLILCLYNLGRGRNQAAWLLIGHAVRVALHLQLNLPDSSLPAATIKDGRRRHVFLGCFVLDTLISARLHRNSHLGPQDIESIDGSVEENGLEEWEPWVDLSGLRMQEAPLSLGPPLVMSTFNRLISSLRALNTFNRKMSCQRDLSNVSELQEMLSGLPTSFNDRPILPHHFNLRLTQMSTVAMIRFTQYNSKHLAQQNPEVMGELVTLVKQILETVKAFTSTFGHNVIPPTFLQSLLVCYRIRNAFDLRGEVDSLPTEWRNNIVDELRSWVDSSTTQQSAVQRGPMATRIPGSSSSEILKPDTRSFESTSLPFNPTNTQNTQMQGITNSFGTPNSMPDVSRRPDVVQSDMFRSASVEGPRPPYHIGNNSFGSRQTSMNAQNIVGPSTTGNVPSALGNSQVSPTGKESHDMAYTNQNFSTSTNLDQDLVFNDLAMVDATQWTGLYDQSLMNLGFTNSANIDQEFLDFCRDF